MYATVIIQIILSSMHGHLSQCPTKYINYHKSLIWLKCTNTKYHMSRATQKGPLAQRSQLAKGLCTYVIMGCKLVVI